jgi:hypothetical protein
LGQLQADNKRIPKQNKTKSKPKLRKEIGLARTILSKDISMSETTGMTSPSPMLHLEHCYGMKTAKSLVNTGTVLAPAPDYISQGRWKIP